MSNVTAPEFFENYGCLLFQGPDAESFLQGQFTCDLRQLSTEKALLGAWCNLQGRAVATFRLARWQEDILLVCDRTLVAPLKEKLARYALFSQVEITNLSDDCTLAGFSAPDQLPLACHDDFQATASDPEQLVIRWGYTDSRYLLVSRPPLTTSPAMPASDWQAQDLLQGIALIPAEASEKELPQALNLDVLGGISYNKGCYLGQEVIARLHFKGKLKQRLHPVIGEIAQPPEPCCPVFSSGKSQPAGHLVHHVIRGSQLITTAVIRHEAAAEGILHLGSKTGPELHVKPLPYAIP